MRKIFVWVHRYLGLVMLAFIMLAAITGSLISFDKEIDRWLNDDWMVVKPAGQPLAMDVLVENAKQGQSNATVSFVKMDKEPQYAYQISVNTPSQNHGGGLHLPQGLKREHVFVNQYTGAVLGKRVTDEFSLDKRHLMPTLNKLHFSLYLKELGLWIMGVVAVAWLLDHFWAVYLSFPSLKNWKNSFKFRLNRGRYKLNFDLHRSGSMWLLPILLMLSLSSVYLNFNGPFKQVVSWFAAVTPSEVTHSNHQGHKPPPPPALAIGAWQQAYDTAQKTFVQQKITGLLYQPQKAEMAAFVTSEQDITAENGMTRLYIDLSSMQVKKITTRADETRADTFMAWLFPLHNGRAFGWVGQAIICLAGLIITVICLTGYWIYVRKGKAKKAQLAIYANQNRYRT